ncbi:MAG: hypothetical protein AAFR35_12250 [Pseudomonadota bacterium]
MRLALALAAGLATVLFDAAPAAAQSWPPGTYVETCVDMQVRRGRHLTALCRKTNGEFRASTLYNYGGCVTQPANTNGRLTCTRGPKIQGSYQASCIGIHWVYPGKDLWAMCRDDRQEVPPFKKVPILRDSYLDWSRCHGGIRSMYGHLDCARTPLYDLPDGSYTATCRLPELKGAELTAICRRIDTSWQRTSLFEPARCAGDISNEDGTLRCTFRPSSDSASTGQLAGYPLRRIGD